MRSEGTFSEPLLKTLFNRREKKSGPKNLPETPVFPKSVAAVKKVDEGRRWPFYSTNARISAIRNHSGFGHDAAALITAHQTKTRQHTLGRSCRNIP